MNIVGALYEKLFAQVDIYQVIRLVVIIGGYMIFRARAQDWLKTRQLKAQLAEDQRVRAAKQQREQDGGADELYAEQQRELDDLQAGGDAAKEGIQDPNDKSWGWGKKTRARQRELQRKFEEKIEAAAVAAQKRADGGYDSDEEIKQYLDE